MERNQKQRKLLSKGPKYRESVSLSLYKDFCLNMNAPRRVKLWTKEEDVEVDTLS